ncbi:MAG: flagellin FliC [Bdellovibrionales bacterium]|nr:flagellin FliC [Bdellovibrionales bacterium]
MGLRINTNMMSINAQRNLRGTQLSMATASERLSSGQRINKSADDAAGLAISENLGGSIRSFKQSNRNAQDGISFIQVAEGGMNEVSNMIQRLRELSVQAASDTIGEKERTYLDREAQQLKSEMERIAQGTEYNGTKLLNGQGKQLDFQIGIKNDAFLDRISYNPALTDVSTGALGLSDISVNQKEKAQESLAKLDGSLIVLNSNRAHLGALQNRLNSTINNTEVAIENLSAAKSRIRDADVAAESAELARTNIMLQSGISVLAQANQSTAVALKLLG